MARPREIVDRRRRILAAAREQFGRYGFDRATVDDIANFAGMSKGSVYQEFKTKNDILKAVVGDLLVNEQKRAEKLVENLHPPYLDMLHELIVPHICHVYETCTENFHSAEMLTVATKWVAKEMADYFETYNNAIRTILERAYQNQEIDYHPDWEQLAWLVKTAFRSFFPPYDQMKVGRTYRDLGLETLKADATQMLYLMNDGLKGRALSKLKMRDCRSL